MSVKAILIQGAKELGYEVAKLLGKKIAETAAAMQMKEQTVIYPTVSGSSGSSIFGTDWGHGVMGPKEQVGD